MSKDQDLISAPRLKQANVEKMLSKGPEGVREFNDLRERGQKIESLDTIDLRSLDLTNINFYAANLRNAKFCRRDEKSPPCNLTFADLRKANMPQANLEGAILDHADLAGALFTPGTNCKSARLTNATLNGTDFKNATLVDADLRGAAVDHATRLEGAKVAGCRIDRYTLECLEDYGDLTKGQRMQMHIEDGVATLRSTYSGFWAWLHLIALTLFLFPYVNFVFRRWLEARFYVGSIDGTIALWQAFGRYVWNGGRGWETGRDLAVWPFMLFCIALAYNILRLVLLAKTKTLEAVEQASGLPAMFSLDGRWRTVYLAAKWGLYVNLLVVAAHTWHFLQQRIPVNP